MLSQIKKSYHILPSQNESVRRWKRDGRRVFGYVCINIPEEIIYAAGILPFRILGTADDLTLAHNYCAGFLCHRMKSILELGLKGELSLLDGVVMGYGCEGGMTTMQPLIENVRFPYYEYLLLPHSRRPNAYVYFQKELARFKQSLEDFTGTEITEAALKEAIRACNGNRAMLTKAYNLRGGKRPRLSGVEVAEMVMSSMVMPKDEHNRLLAGILAEVEKRQDLWGEKEPRIHICGTLIPPDFELFRLIEELGGMVVSDDLCLGSRYFWGQVDTTLPPLEALTNYYMDARSHCPWVYADNTWKMRTEFVEEMIKRYEVDGVVTCAQKWCDPFLFHQPILAEELRKRDVPVLSIEVDQSFDIAPLRTRLQAFFEMIKEGKTR